MTTATVELVKPNLGDRAEALTSPAETKAALAFRALLGWFVGLWATWPELVAEVRPVIAGMVAYSREGEWTLNLRSFWRGAHLLYTLGFAVPVVALLYVARWTVERPGRLLAVGPAVVIVGTASAFFPVVGALVPHFLNVTTWL